MSEKNKAMSETFCPIFTKFIYDNVIIEQKIAPFLLVVDEILGQKCFHSRVPVGSKNICMKFKTFF